VGSGQPGDAVTSVLCVVGFYQGNASAPAEFLGIWGVGGHQTNEIAAKGPT